MRLTKVTVLALSTLGVFFLAQQALASTTTAHSIPAEVTTTTKQGFDFFNGIISPSAYSTLVNLFSGLAGAILGVFGAFAISWRQHRREKRAVLYAIRTEVVNNQMALSSIGEHKRLIWPLRSDVWETMRYRLPGLVPFRVYNEVAKVYTFDTVYREILDKCAAGGEIDHASAENLNTWIKELFDLSLLLRKHADRKGYYLSRIRSFF